MHCRYRIPAVDPGSALQRAAPVAAKPVCRKGGGPRRLCDLPGTLQRKSNNGPHSSMGATPEVHPMGSSCIPAAAHPTATAIDLLVPEVESVLAGLLGPEGGVFGHLEPASYRAWVRDIALNEWRIKALGPDTGKTASACCQSASGKIGCGD